MFLRNCLKIKLPLLFLFLILFSCQTKNIRKLNDEHQKALSSIAVMDGFQVEMFAAEPLIADPVAMEIDENGDMYVVEMHGYPLDLSNSGKIKLLKDTDGDGFPDKSILFADSLKLPNGIQRWKNGFIVTDTPDVLYLEDTNGDGKADIRKKILTGFALSNPQHNLNNPRFELDNWIYLGHEGAVTPFVFKKEFGDTGAEIRFSNNNKAPKLGVNANGRMVRFKPETFELEEMSGETQYGHTQDAWGHHIYTSNANHLFHEVIAKKYIDNNPNLLIPQATQNISDHGDACEIFPKTLNPNHQLLTDVGVITSSCGVTWYLGGAFGDKFKNVTFIAEPVHNLIHADIIENDGSTFKAKRLLEKKEFLTSTDGWFRPVNFYIGPDGALYVIDYYRQIIEHPEWMSDEINKSGALYNGKDKGRIYRISPKTGLDKNWLGKLNLSKKTDVELLELFDNKNVWYRRTIQRMLIHRNAKSIIPELRKMVSSAKNPEAKVNALWLLDELKGLNIPTLEIALQDKESGLRENAVKLSEKFPELYPKLCEMNDQSTKVRFQLINTFGQNKHDGVFFAIENIMKLDKKDKWSSIAAIASQVNFENKLLEKALLNLTEKPTEQSLEFYTYLGATFANKGDKESFQLAINMLGTLKNSENNDLVKASFLNGIKKLWAYKGLTFPIEDKFRNNLLDNISSKVTELRNESLELLSIVGLPANIKKNMMFINAERNLLDTQQKEAFRIDMLKLLAANNSLENNEIFKKLIISNHPEKIQMAAIQVLAIKPNRNLCKYLIDNWSKMKLPIRNEAINLYSNEPATMKMLLNAIQTNKVDKNEIGWGRTVSMLNYYDFSTRNLARKILSLNEDRKAVLQKYLAVIDNKGNKLEGKKVFEANCKICHQINNEGVDFGPNLNTLRSRNATSIVTEIINPNNSIADRYDSWNLTFKNGQKMTGIIANENANSLTLKEMGGNKTTIQRSEILKIEKNKISTMPNGLENAINPSQMIDLVAYIKNL